MKQRIDFINSLGLALTREQLNELEEYADLVWDKKEILNLTSVKDKQEIWDRHILDGLVSAALINKAAPGQNISAADFGAGAGYIGVSIKIALAEAAVTLIESLERRCKFMEWAVFKLGLKNVKVLNARAGAHIYTENFDFTTERAMGKIADILPLCTESLKEGGYFMPYQAIDGLIEARDLQKAAVREESVFKYILPYDGKLRKIVVLRKNGHNSKN
jgi:16S rRNA (guanine527-N7)-methyltransferase